MNNIPNSISTQKLSKLILEQIGTGIWITNKSDEFIFFNKAMEKISGLKRKDILGKNIKHDLPKKTMKGKAKFIHYYNRAKDTKEKIDYENLPIKTPGGNLSYQSGSLIPLLDEENHLKGIICTVEDISELHKYKINLEKINKKLEKAVKKRTKSLKKANEQLEYERNLFELYMDTADIMLLALDKHKNVMYINKKGVEMVGAANKNEVIGKNWFKSFLPSNLEPSIDEIFQNIAFGENWEKEGYREKEHYIKTLKGEYKLIRWKNAVIRDKNGDIIGSLSSGEDVTQKRKMERKIAQNQRYESISILAGGIAHDFNNYLAAIMGNLNLAMMETDENPEITESLKDGLKACKEARNLTNQLLTFSKGGCPVIKSLDPGKVIRNAEKISLSGKKSFVEIVGGTIPYNIRGDPGQIKQIFINLFLNAHEAMEKGGKIKVSLRLANEKEVKEAQLPFSRYMIISVKDKGKGMDKKTKERIFDLYYTTKKRGRGIGMAVVYSIIKKHNGKIEIKSKPGQGTIITLFIPCEKKKEKQFIQETQTHTISDNKYNDDAQKEDIRELRRKKGGQWKHDKTALILDDNEFILNFLSKMMNKLGFSVDICTKGEQAIQKYKEAYQNDQSYDVIILDLIVKKGMGGEETIKEIKKIDPKVKAIVSSGYSRGNILSKHKEYGFSEILKKPYNFKKLERILKKLEIKSE